MEYCVLHNHCNNVDCEALSDPRNCVQDQMWRFSALGGQSVLQEKKTSQVQGCFAVVEISDSVCKALCSPTVLLDFHRSFL